MVEIAAEAALNTPSSYFNEVIKEYEERRDVLINELNKIDGVICPVPKGAFYVIAQLPIDNLIILHNGYSKSLI